jgi:hypothetical protein
MTPTNKTRLLLNVLMLTAASNTYATIQTINFDTDALGNAINAPTLFSAATPLTDLYVDQGVTFSALDRTAQITTFPKDGIETTQSVNVLNTASAGMGSILNQGANFGNNAKSGDNFLAFNNQSASSANFWRISFDNPIGYFGIAYSNGSSSTYQYLNFQAYDANGDLIGTSNNNYLGDYSYYRTNFFSKAFKSDTDISYIDIGQGLNCCGNNLTASERTGTWSLTFDDLIYGDYTDAPVNVYNLSGGGTYVPLPGAVWLMLSGLIGIFSMKYQRINQSSVAG